MENPQNNEQKESSICSLAGAAKEMLVSLLEKLKATGVMTKGSKNYIPEVCDCYEMYRKLSIRLGMVELDEDDAIEVDGVDETFGKNLRYLIDALRDKGLTLSSNKDGMYDGEILKIALEFGEFHKLLPEISRLAEEIESKRIKDENDVAVEKEYEKIPTQEKIIKNLKIQLIVATVLASLGTVGIFGILGKTAVELDKKDKKIERLHKENERILRECNSVNRATHSVIKPLDK